MSALGTALATLYPTRDAILALGKAASVGYVPNADAEVFAKLIREGKEAELQAQNSGLRMEHLTFTGTPTVFWTGIMQEAVKQHLVDKVLKNLRHRFPAEDFTGDVVRRWDLTIVEAWKSGGPDGLTALVDHALGEHPDEGGRLRAALGQEIRERTTAGQAEAVNRAFRSLDELMKDPQILPEVVAYGDDFDRAHQQIEILGVLKALHDLLHDLQIASFIDIDGQVRNAVEGAPIDWDLLADKAVIELANGLTQVQEVVDRKVLRAFPIDWVRDLAEGFDGLNSAVQDDCADQASRLDAFISAGMRLASVMRTQPQRLAQEADSAAQYLQLDRLALALENIHAALIAKGADPGRLGEIGRGIMALREMDESLNRLISEHSRWQSLDSDFRQIDEARSVTTKLFARQWVILKARVVELLGDATDPQAKMFVARGEKLSAALVTGDPAALATHFSTYRRQQVMRFHYVDKMLLELCGKLRTFDNPLGGILGRLP